MPRSFSPTSSQALIAVIVVADCAVRHRQCIFHCGFYRSGLKGVTEPEPSIMGALCKTWDICVLSIENLCYSPTF